jgi:hypothetical protein
MMKSRLPGALVAIVLLVSLLSMSGTTAAGIVPGGAQIASPPVTGSSPGASAAVDAANGASPASQEVPNALGSDATIAAGANALSILHIYTTDTALSVRRALTELGYTPILFSGSDWTAINFSPYDVVIVGMDGGSVAAASVQKLRTDVIDQGKRLIMIGGTCWQDFAIGVNAYLVLSDTVNFCWTISSQPHWTRIAPDHLLGQGLPASYNFTNPSAAYYQLRAMDPSLEVVGRNGDGFDSLFYKGAGFLQAGGGVEQGTGLVWFIHSAYSSYWQNPADFAVLKRIILNAIRYPMTYLHIPATLLNTPWDPYYEPNNFKQDAYGSLASGLDYLAYPDDTNDYYFFTLTSQQTVDILVSDYVPTSNNGDLLIYDEVNPSPIEQFGQPGYTEMSIEDLVLPAGKYYVRIYTSSGFSDSSLYTLRVTY